MKSRTVQPVMPCGLRLCAGAWRDVTWYVKSSLYAAAIERFRSALRPWAGCYAASVRLHTNAPCLLWEHAQRAAPAQRA